MSVNERREIELKNHDKTVAKMSRDGLVEENLSTGTRENVSRREQDFDPAQPAAEEARPTEDGASSGRRPRASAGAERDAGAGDAGATFGSDQPRPRQSTRHHEQADAGRGPDTPDTDAPASEQDAGASGASGGDSPLYERESKLLRAESKLDKAESKLAKAKKKQPKKKKLRTEKVYDEAAGKTKRRFFFEDEIKTTKKSNLVTGAAKAAGNATLMQAHRKLYQVEKENVGTEAAHRTELAGETLVRGIAHRRKTRIQKAHKRVAKMENKTLKARANVHYERALKKNPEMQGGKNALQKYLHKRSMQKKYIKQARKDAAKGAATGISKAVATGKKAVQAVASAVTKNPAVVAIGMAAVLLTLMVVSLFGTGGSMVGQAGLTLLGGTYVAEDEAINQAELYYTEKETDLQFQAYALENQNPDYDEYRYNIGEVAHNAYELMAYLNAKYNDFTFDGVQAELDAIFAQQYTLWTEEIIEIRTREVEVTDPVTLEVTTETEEYEYRIFCINITVKLLSEILAPRMDTDQTQMYDTYMTTYGNRWYFSPPFDFNWTYYMSSGYGYRVHPITGEKDNHQAVDISAPEGTPIKAVQHGVVTFAGWDDSYGNYVVIEDSEEGFKSLYAHCHILSVSTGQTITRGDVIATVGTTGDSTGNHLHLEVYRDGININPSFIVDPGTGYLDGGAGGNPGAPYDDEMFARLMEEATKYIGYPYVWGGGNPSTSFDCSGYVSWCYTQSGVYNIGHDTAQGIYNRCAIVTDPRPGDLVFFHSTYSTSRLVTHVGIYVGNGQMLHCGNPIGYTDLSYSYWQSHFLAYGRLV